MLLPVSNIGLEIECCRKVRVDVQYSKIKNLFEDKDTDGGGNQNKSDGRSEIAKVLLNL